MSLSLLKLHLAQAGKSLQKARNNNYSDKEKQDYQDNLILLFDKIDDEISAQVSVTDFFCFEQKKLIDFIYKSLEFLDSSTLNLIPYETVECLKLALYDWILPSDKYLIVTSLINAVSGFSFDPTLVEVDKYYDLFEYKYGIKFKTRLVQINIPKALSRDYLAGVAHYHELGHFIDIKYAITDSLSKEILLNWLRKDPSIKELYKSFPFLANSSLPQETVHHALKYNLGEYFCDLFASQYISNSLNKYLLYLTENNRNYSLTHPSTINRTEVVNDFLSGTQNPVITQINRAVKNILGKELEILFEPVSKEDFYNFLPPIIKNPRQLHGLVSTGWDIWCSDWDPFMIQMKMPHLPEPIRMYTIINNLIEKSIGNYFIEKRWKSLA